MTTAETTTTAPDARALIDLLTERLHDNGQDMPEIRENASTLMLMERFSPTLRQQLYDFLQDCILEDLIYAKVLVLKNPAEPNRFLTLVHAIDPIRTINRGRVNHSKTAMDDLIAIYTEMWFSELGRELTQEEVFELIGVHFAYAIGADFEFGVTIADHFPRHPDLLKEADLLIPALSEAMRYYGRFNYTNEAVNGVLEVAEYILERPSEASRITATITTHKGFDRGFMDELLAASRTPIEEGML